MLVIAATVAPAQAQEIQRDRSARETSVLNRSRPLYDPICLNPNVGASRSGSPVFVCPTVDLALGFEDNVFRTREGAESDVYYGLRPGLTVRADWPTHTFTVGAEGDIRRYGDATTNDYTDYRVFARGESEVSDQARLSAELAQAREHEDRGDPDSPAGVTDVNVFNVTSLAMQARYRPSRIFFDAQADVERIDYRDNGPIDNDSRDRIEYAGRVRLGYQLGASGEAPRPETLAFVEAGANRRDYDRERDRFGFEQGSYGYSAGVGLRYDISALVLLEASAGWFRQAYVEEAFDASSGLQAQLDLTWNPTDLLTVDAAVGRSVEEVATIAGSSSVVETRGDLGFAYEIAYDWVARSGVSAVRAQFEGVSRRDTDLGLRLGVTHYLNEFVSLDATIRRNQRTSTVGAAEYTAHSGTLTLRLQY